MNTVNIELEEFLRIKALADLNNSAIDSIVKECFEKESNEISDKLREMKLMIRPMKEMMLVCIAHSKYGKENSDLPF